MQQRKPVTYQCKHCYNNYKWRSSATRHQKVCVLSPKFLNQLQANLDDVEERIAAMSIKINDLHAKIDAEIKEMEDTLRE